MKLSFNTGKEIFLTRSLEFFELIDKNTDIIIPNISVLQN
jgi:hypothetical protein